MRPSIPSTSPDHRIGSVWFNRVAKFAVNQAGLDSIMVNASSGYLIGQFCDIFVEREDGQIG